MSKIDSKFIVNLQGKNFVTYEGLLDLAHQSGLLSIETELIQSPAKDNDMTAIVKARAITEKGHFEDIGDANPNSVNNMLKPHIIRMASTRAKARALRDLTNIGMTAVEEISDQVVDSDNGSSTPPTGSTQKTSGDLATDKQIGVISKIMKSKNYSQEDMSKHIKETYKKSNSKELTKGEASSIIQMLNKR